MAREREVKVKILGDSSSAQRALNSLDKGSSRTGSILRGLGKAALYGGAALAGGLVIGGKIAIDNAADVGEAVNKAKVIFEESARSILKWSKDTADSMGLAREESLEAASGFAAMLDTAGVAQRELAPMSKSLVKLAGDMASFNNQDPSEMLEKLRSGLAGEAEPLRRFGVFISEAAMQTQALKDGLIEQGEEMTEAQKVQARYNLILEQTQKQQGDFARTQDSLPNLLRRAQASVTDLSAVVGKALLPVFTSMVAAVVDFAQSDDFQAWMKDAIKWLKSTISSIAEFAGPVISDAIAAVKAIASWVSNLSKDQKRLAVTLGLVLAALIPVTSAFHKLSPAIRAAGSAILFLSKAIMAAIAATGPIGMAAAAVALLATVIITNWDTIKEVTGKVFAAVRDFIVGAFNAIARVVGNVIAFMIRTFGKMVDFHLAGIELMVRAVAKVSNAFRFLPGSHEKATNELLDSVVKMRDGVASGFDRAADAADSWGARTRSEMASVGAAARGVAAIVNSLAASISRAFDAAGNVGGGGGGGSHGGRPAPASTGGRPVPASAQRGVLSRLDAGERVKIDLQNGEMWLERGMGRVMRKGLAV